MESEAPLLEARGLAVTVSTAQGPRTALGPLDLDLDRDGVTALLGESGSGKSLLALALGWLAPPGARLAGTIRLGGREIQCLSEGELSEIRGRRIGFVLQEPGTALNPVYSVGFQLREVLRLHRGMGRREAAETAAGLLAELGFRRPREILRAFPHQLSGGQQQRVILAMALAPDPELLVADEPTAALDPVLRARTMGVIARWRRRTRASLLLVSHDARTAQALARRAVILYAGEVVEEGPAAEVLATPLHPYTRFLTGDAKALSRPDLPPPAPGTWEPGCRLRPRCAMAGPGCARTHPELEPRAEGRRLRCPPATSEGAA